MIPIIAGWISAALVFVALDAIWLSQMAVRFYRPLIGEILAPNVNFGAAIAFYLLYISGLVFFAVMPALERGGLGKALLYGALVGLLAYGTYDLTNHATLKVWDLRITLADMAWGAFLTAASAGGGYLVASRFS